MVKQLTSHFQQYESTPNIELIVETLRKENIVADYIFSKNWISFAHEIIKNIEEAISKSNNNKTINLTVLVKDIEEERFDEDERLWRIIGWDDDEFQKVEEHNRYLLKEILKKKFLLESTIRRILSENLHFGRGNMIRAREEYLIANIKNIGKLSTLKRTNNINTTLATLNLNEIKNELDKLIKIPKQGQVVEIRLNQREFLSAFASRIDIFKDFVQKDDLIQKFENRKKQKRHTSYCYISVSALFFLMIFSGNLYLFYKYFSVNRKLNFQEFLEYFFGQNIYFFTTEIFLLFLAFYFLSLFKAYLKIIELYDSHILLIEADFFYKNDEHFQNLKDEKALFEMRKENAQKIHMLPEKTFDLLNGKDSIQEKNISIKFIEDLLETIKNIFLNKK